MKGCVGCRMQAPRVNIKYNKNQVQGKDINTGCVGQI